ncbi:MAG TPA: hypothetical protein VLM11_21930 [Streptosporangiaceae bacterium]|nr:hypothetical protein [Streptosporangiaceae bacterium]
MTRNAGQPRAATLLRHFPAARAARWLASSQLSRYLADLNTWYN